MRIGIDRPVAIATGKPEDWAGAEPLASYPVADFAALAEVRRARPVTVLDVRRDLEWAAGHIDGAVHIPLHELTAPVTTLLAVAYKSRITILVPPGVRVEAGGFGTDTDTDPAAVVPADAPVLHVRGFTYKGTVDVRSRPPED